MFIIGFRIVDVFPILVIELGGSCVDGCEFVGPLIDYLFEIRPHRAKHRVSAFEHVGYKRIDVCNLEQCMRGLDGGAEVEEGQSAFGRIERKG